MKFLSRECHSWHCQAAEGKSSGHSAVDEADHPVPLEAYIAGYQIIGSVPKET